MIEVNQEVADAIHEKLIDVITEYDEIDEGTMALVVCDMDNFLNSLVSEDELPEQLRVHAEIDGFLEAGPGSLVSEDEKYQSVEELIAVTYHNKKYDFESNPESLAEHVYTRGWLDCIENNPTSKEGEEECIIDRCRHKRSDHVGTMVKGHCTKCDCYSYTAPYINKET